MWCRFVLQMSSSDDDDDRDDDGCKMSDVSNIKLSSEVSNSVSTYVLIRHVAVFSISNNLGL